MPYYEAISNAIGARGNALAQGALQSGQVWGNLAANLGQIPGQAIAFHQQRQDALQNHELKKMALEKAQRDAEEEKATIRIVNSNAPDLQKIAELKNVLRGNPEKFLALQRLESEEQYRQQQAGAQRYKILEDQPGSVAPAGGQFALPEPTRGVTTPDVGLGTGGARNAFAPPVPIESQLVHPDIPGLGAPPTRHQNIQGKIAEIDASDLSPADKADAKRALFLPAAAFRAGGPPPVGLGVSDYVGPDGITQISGQSTRSGHVLITVGNVHDPVSGRTYQPGDLAPASVMANWTKVYHQGIQAFPNQSGGIDVLNKQKLGYQMNKTGTLTGTVPDINPREQWMPVTDKNDKIIGWSNQSRPGTFVPYEQGRPGAGGPPSPNRPDLFKSGQPEATKTAETSIKTLQDSINRIDALSQKHPDVSGRLMGNLEKGKAWFGWSEEEVDDLITETNNLRNTYLKMVSGGQVTPSEDARLSPVVPDVGQPPARLKNNIARFKRIVNIMAEVRQSGRESATDEELKAALGETKAAAPSAPAAGGDTVNIRLPDGSVGTIPRANLSKAKLRGAVEVK